MAAAGSLGEAELKRDGLPGNMVRALVQARDGHVWIGTDGGAMRYGRRLAPPSVRVVDVTTDRPHGPVAAVRLPSTRKYLAFDFRGTSFKARPGAMLYRYRLAGWDEAWHTTRSGHVAYRDLPVGDYAFEVVAVDGDLGYSPRQATVDVRVHPPYERIAWVSALGLAAGLAVLQGVRVVRRDRRLRQSKEQLLAQIREREHLEAERARMDQQLQALRYLDRLRSELEDTRALADAVERTGRTLVEAVATITPATVRIDCDVRTWTFGARDAGGHGYERALAWGDHERGRLRLECGLQLSESQQRMLVDETAPSSCGASRRRS